MGRKIGCSSDDVKVSVNLSPVDVGMIDLLRGKGWHSTRSDLIRTALHGYFSDHRKRIDHIIDRDNLIVTTERFDRARMEEIERAGERVRINAIGKITLGADVSDELAARVVDRLLVYGILEISDELREALGSRILR